MTLAPAHAYAHYSINILIKRLIYTVANVFWCVFFYIYMYLHLLTASEQLRDFRAETHAIALELLGTANSNITSPAAVKSVSVMDSLSREAAARFVCSRALCKNEQSAGSALDTIRTLVTHTDYEVRYSTLKQLCVRVRDPAAGLDIAGVHALALQRLFVESYRRCTGQLLKLLRLTALPLPVNEVLQLDAQGKCFCLSTLLYAWVPHVRTHYENA